MTKDYISKAEHLKEVEEAIREAVMAFAEEWIPKEREKAYNKGFRDGLNGATEKQDVPNRL